MSEKDRADRSAVQRLPISAWSAETLRLTAFPDPPTQPDASLWWDAVAGEPPDSVSEEPKRGSRTTSIAYGSGKLVLQLLPGRIDWLLTTDEPSGDGFPSLGNYLQNLDMFTELVSRWFGLAECPVVRRLAFGAILLHTVQGREEGYRQLQPYLPSVQLDPVTSSDFHYRINRRRDSGTGIAGLVINRLTSWSVAALQPAFIQLGPGRMLSTHGPTIFSCRLELDVNTPPDFEDTLSPEALPEIFRELVDLGSEIIEQGDIP